MRYYACASMPRKQLPHGHNIGMVIGQRADD
jgi:hypothetical protein